MADFLKRLNEALEADLKLGKWVGDNKEPKPVDLEGEKKKSADAAHKPLDPGVEHTELENEDEFDSRDHEQSEQARPALKPDLK